MGSPDELPAEAVDDPVCSLCNDCVLACWRSGITIAITSCCCCRRNWGLDCLGEEAELAVGLDLGAVLLPPPPLSPGPRLGLRLPRPPPPPPLEWRSVRLNSRRKV